MKNNYKIIYIYTKNKKRKIVKYSNVLIREQHKFIANKIDKIFEPSIFTKGYIKNQSIYTNAYSHLYNNYFIKTDIKNFFQNINHNLMIKELYKEINSIASPKDCYDIVKLCSINEKGLPLGLISSPILSNIYLKRFDILLYKKLKYIKCDNIVYTRYADDIIVSFKKTDEDLITIKNQILNTIEDCLKLYKMKMNYKKTKFISFYKTKQVRITGITIVEKNGKRRISIGRNNKRKLFYRAINYKKSINKSLVEKNKIKGLLSFYLSIEKENYESFITDNMRKEIFNFGYESFIDFVKNL